LKKKAYLFILVIILTLSCFPQKLFAGENVPETITLQLRWDNQFQFAGYYAADWKGFYKEEGLNVNIISAVKSDGTILSSTKEVSEGRADFGIGAADILIANDSGADLRVTAVIMQKSAARYYLKKETPFTSISDFTRLKVARNVNDLIDVELQAMLLNEGIDPKIVKAYPHQTGMDHLLTDKVQVIPGYILSMPLLAKEQGVEIKEINPQNYGVDFCGDSLFVSGALTDKNPELVERFVRASLKGWQYALDNPDEIAARITKELKTVRKFDDFYGFNIYQAEIMQELTDYKVIEVGHINPYRWQKMHGYLRQIGLVKNDINISKFIFDPVKLQTEKDRRVRNYFIWGSAGLFGLIAVILLWVYFLKRSVKLKNNELKKKELSLIESQRAKEEILHLSYHDTLTDLYNRTFFDEEIKRLDTKRQLPISIIMGDLNGLKLVNDAFGHYEGDKIIKKAADILKRACRSDDIVARWGGDEFIVLLPKTIEADSEEIIERIKKLVKLGCFATALFY